MNGVPRGEKIKFGSIPKELLGINMRRNYWPVLQTQLRPDALSSEMHLGYNSTL